MEPRVRPQGLFFESSYLHLFIAGLNALGLFIIIIKLVDDYDFSQQKIIISAMHKRQNASYILRKSQSPTELSNSSNHYILACPLYNNAEDRIQLQYMN